MRRVLPSTREFQRVTPNFDLHCHSTASDGLLGPADLVRRAAERGVTTLALTDHDELSGLDTAREAARSAGIRFVDGVEISVTWGGITVHIVGLGIDPTSAALAAGLESVRNSRVVRAERMASELAAAGMGLLLISSELPEILGMCDRILVLHGGRIVGEFPRGQATEDAIIHSIHESTSKTE